MYFELTLDHKFSLYCASFKAFTLYTGPEDRHRLRVSLYTPGCKRRLRAYTQSHYSPTAHRKKTLLSYYRPHTNPSAMKTWTCRMCFDYLLTTCLNLEQCHWAAWSFWAEFRLSQSSTGTLHPCIYWWQAGTSQARSRWTWCHWSQHARDQLFWSQPLSPAVQGVFSAPDHLLKKPILQQLVFEHVREQSAEILSKE